MTVRAETGSQRYGGSTAVAGSVLAFVLLFFFALVTIIDSAHLMSTNCFDSSGQRICPIDGPDWIRPVPGITTAVGLLTGLAGVLAGRPFRTAALIAGFLLTAAALTISRLVG